MTDTLLRSDTIQINSVLKCRYSILYRLIFVYQRTSNSKKVNLLGSKCYVVLNQRRNYGHYLLVH